MAEPKTILLQGNTNDATSFAILNRHLADGLRGRGYDVTVFSGGAAKDFPVLKGLPDVYLFQGFGFDLVSAPGRLNVFLLTYEYPRLERRFRILVDRLNHYFDLVLTPSTFVRDICRRCGIRIPVEVCPYGFDRAEFHPAVEPLPLPTKKNFRFLNLGGFTDRKGTDVLLRAYLAEFRAEEDVCLVIKVRGYELEQPWVERVLARFSTGRARGPEVLLHHADFPSVAGYYTAADVGVFPHRGEGFGLPILECLASGRPVIVTHGTGPMDFCTCENTRFIRASRKTSRGRDMLEPDAAHLRRLMREAFEGGKPAASEQARISRSVRSYSWEHWTNLVEAAVRRHKGERGRPRSAPRGSVTEVLYSFYRKGTSGIGKCVSRLDRSLRSRYRSYRAASFSDPPPTGAERLVVSQSGYALEAFVRSPGAVRILHAETGRMEACVEVLNRERRRCGLQPIRQTAMEVWRGNTERELADCIIVASTASRRRLLAGGCDARKIRVAPWGLDARRSCPRRNPGKLRFLFAAADPCRKGIGVLFEAWDRLRPKGAELWCLIDEQVLQSPFLINFLVRNPGITVRPLVSYREFLGICRETDCHVLASFDDSFSLSTGDSMGFGKPAIVSDATGIADLISHGTNGLIVPAGSAEKLMRAIAFCCEDSRRVREMGEAAYETAREWSWDRFGGQLIALTGEYLK